MLDIYFITSSRAKIEHAKFLCKDFSINILRQKQYGIGYLEPRILNRKQLLEESIHDAINRLKKVTNSFGELFVLIEDTSIIIDALSSTDNEYPGVEAKFWMEQTKFNDLDVLLKSKGNNRKVTVRSDLILFLPEKLQVTVNHEFLHFTSISNGTIAKKEYEFTTQELYPWLSNRTFNKWFVPEGESLPISLLAIEKADLHDFRKGAFKEMLTFLQAHQLIKPNPKNRLLYKQLNLFNLSLFIVCGKSCAGKTTISDFLTLKYGFYHIEASDFMYLSYYEKHGPKSEVKIAEFALKALKENPSIVVDQIIRHLAKIKKGLSFPIVISGFRSPEEIENFKLKYTGKLDIVDIFIDANQELRFERCIMRGRNDKVKTIEDFQEIDKQQEEMGLLGIKQQIQAENIIANNGSMREYYKNFENRYSETLEYLRKPKTKNVISKSGKLEHAILLSMAKHREEFLTTTEITHLVNSNIKDEKKKQKDNISRYFNQKYYPYFEIMLSENGKLKYKLSQTGFSLSQLLTKI
jgi:dephospho-CoA kinase/inosine/xanthosine triphosphate pyrophosphatase family protein